MKKNNLILALFLFLTVSLFLASFVSAQNNDPELGRDPEANYPTFLNTTIDKTITLPRYITYIYYAIITISALVALFSLIYGGLQYIMSAGSPEKIKKSKDQILGTFVGIIIILCSHIILTTVNPDLIHPKSISAPPTYSDLSPGVYLCKESIEGEMKYLYDNYHQYLEKDQLFKNAATSEEKVQIRREMITLIEGFQEKKNEINEKCYRTGSGNIEENFNNLVTDVCFYPDRKWQKINTSWQASPVAEYGAVLYEDENENKSSKTGKAQVFWRHLAGGTPRKIENVNYKCETISLERKPSSILTFQFTNYSGNIGSNLEVIAYEAINYNIGLINKEEITIKIPDKQYGYQDDFFFPPESIKISEGLMVILGSIFYEKQEVLFADDNNLNDNYPLTNEAVEEEIKEKCPGLSTGETCRYTVATEIIIMTAKKY